MARENEWDRLASERTASPLGAASMGVLRMSLLFGSAAVAIALLVAPIAENYARPQFSSASVEGLDLTSTGSVPRGGSYTIRKSVLQAQPDSVCIIRANGRRSGDC
jgi:hypothetical protein